MGIGTMGEDVSSPARLDTEAGHVCETELIFKADSYELKASGSKAEVELASVSGWDNEQLGEGDGM